MLYQLDWDSIRLDWDSIGLIGLDWIGLDWNVGFSGDTGPVTQVDPNTGTKVGQSIVING